MGVIKIKNENGEIIGLPAIKGANGKSAYAFAKEAGYTGTEEEFASSLANSAGKLGAEHNTDPEAHPDIRALIENMVVGEEVTIETIAVKDAKYPMSSGIDTSVTIGQTFTDSNLGDYGINTSVDVRAVSKGNVIDVNENEWKNDPTYYNCFVLTDTNNIIKDIVYFYTLENNNYRYTVNTDGYIYIMHNGWGTEDDVMYSIYSKEPQPDITKMNERIDTLEEALNLTDVEEIVVKLDTEISSIRIGNNKLHINELEIGGFAAGHIYNYNEADERLVIIDATKGTTIDFRPCGNCNNWIENTHGIVMEGEQGIITDIVSVSYLQNHDWTYVVPHDGTVMLYVRFNGDTLCKISNKNTKLVTDYSPLILNAENAALYDSDSAYGDEALQAILNGRQVLVKTPNADGRNFTAIYSPIYMYQIPNNANNYLYLFYLKDEKQNIDLSAVGLGVIQMPLYGQLQMKLSKYYHYNPFG